MEYLEEIGPAEEEVYFQWDGIDSTVTGGHSFNP